MKPEEERFVARQSMFALIVLVVGCLILSLFGLWIAGVIGSATHPMKPLGLVQAALFGVCGVSAFWRLFDRNEQIIVDASGIYWKRWSDQTIPWSEVQEIRETDGPSNGSLGIWLKHPDQYRSTTLLGRVHPMNKSLGFGDIPLTATGTDRSFKDLEQAVLAWWCQSKQS